MTDLSDTSVDTRASRTGLLSSGLQAVLPCFGSRQRLGQHLWRVHGGKTWAKRKPNPAGSMRTKSRSP